MNLRALIEIPYLTILGYKVFLDNFVINLLELVLLDTPKIARLKWEFFKRYFLRPPRWAHKLEGLKGDDLAYGETPFLTLHQVLSWAGYTPSDLFVDLGCGVGKTVLYVTYVLRGRAIGVEVVRAFIEKGKDIAERLRVKNLLLVRDDILNFLDSFRSYREKFRGGRLFIFIPATAFSDDFLGKVQEKLREVIEEDTRVISVSKRLELLESVLQLKGKAELPFSWGKGTIWLYWKLKDKNGDEERA